MVHIWQLVEPTCTLMVQALCDSGAYLDWAGPVRQRGLP